MFSQAPSSQPTCSLNWAARYRAFRRLTEAREERWHVYYGDVHVGTIVASAWQRAGKRLGAALFVDQKLRKASRECSHESCLRRGDDCDAGRTCLRAGKVGAQIRGSRQGQDATGEGGG